MIQKIIIGLCLYSVTIWGQPDKVKFNKIYPPNTGIKSSVAVKPLLDGYLTTGVYGVAGTYAGFYTEKIDSYGNALWQKSLDESASFYATFYGNSLFSTPDGNFLMVGIKGFDQYVNDFIAIKFSPDGDTIWKKTYPTPDREGSVHAIQHHNDGYSIIGWTQHYYPDGSFDPARAYIIRINEAGDTLWTRKLGSQSAAILYSCTTQDGGYLLSGYCHQAATGFDMYAVKTDSLGTVEWEQTYGTPSHDGGCKVVQLPNGNMMLLGWKAGTSTQIYHIAAIDPQTGYQSWQRNYVFNDITGNDGSPLIDDDGNIITIIYNFGGGDSKQNKLTKIDASNGDILWQQIINSGLNPDDDYLRDIEPTPDGGYVLAGFNYNFPQSSWVVKVDSLGNTCGVADCDNYVEPIGVAAVEMEQVFSVYPNPAQDYLVIENHSQEQSATFVLYDVLGRQVLSAVSHNQSVVSVEHLPSGVYLYQFLNPQNQIVAYGKVSVVR